MAAQKPTVFDKYPVAVTPRYQTAEPNEPVVLYEGETSVSIKRQVQAKDATIRLVWLPSSRIEICVADCCTLDPFGDERVTVALRDRPKPLDVRWTSVRMSAGKGATPPSIVGIVQQDKLDEAKDFRRILFHIANGPRFRGSTVRNDPGTRVYAARADLHIPGWRVVVEILPDHQDHNTAQKFKDTGGYAITHVGYIERDDNDLFRFADVEPQLKAVGWLLSFSRGAWAFPSLLVGTDATEVVISESWQCGHIAPMQSFTSWLDDGSSSGLTILSGLHSRLNDELWREPVEFALHWYLVCNDVGHTSIEGAIILQQAAFELLAWTLLVQDRRILSEDGAQKLPASDKLRLLLSECEIPLSIDDGLEALIAVAKEYNWSDGPSATTEIRNALVHANPDKRARILSRGVDCRRDAWTLGQWYLELVLLRLCGYTGSYSNRLRRGGWKGDEVEPVPWSAGDSQGQQPMSQP